MELGHPEGSGWGLCPDILRGEGLLKVGLEVEVLPCGGEPASSLVS